MELLSRSQCKNTEQMVGRNLGTTSDMAEDPGRTYEFFRAVKEPQQGRLKWSTIRSSWIKKHRAESSKNFHPRSRSSPCPNLCGSNVAGRSRSSISGQITRAHLSMNHESVEAKVLEQ